MGSVSSRPPLFIPITPLFCRWAVKLFPLIPSSLLIDSLDLALKAREIDMRASPYDLTAYKGTKDYPFGLGPRFSSDPICVETAEVNEPSPLPSPSQL
jgi:hypothetical protein